MTTPPFILQQNSGFARWRLRKRPLRLNKWLSRYVAETRREDGTPYPPKTIQSLLSGLLRYMRSNCIGEVPNFLQKNDLLFWDLHNAIDNTYRALNSKGIGVTTKSAQILSQEDLNTLWEKQILGVYAPRPLLRAVFFVMGLHACLRGGEEHRQLKFSMLKREDDRWIYTEASYKNRPAGVSAKEVVIHSLPEEGERCPVFILDKYFEQIPHKAIIDDTCFYLKPLPNTNGEANLYTM